MPQMGPLSWSHLFLYFIGILFSFGAYFYFSFSSEKDKVNSFTAKPMANLWLW